jgi:hypothetical protein
MKTGFYLDASNETRRLLWTLAHAHGTLFSMLHLVFGATLAVQASWHPRTIRLASGCLTGAGLLMPAGFFLGGVNVHGGDPGIGIVLAPVGAAMLFVAVLVAARSRPPGDAEPS